MFNSGKLGPGSDDKRRVLDATDIVRLIGEHLALKQKGREFVGLCPFHDDHSPSMNVVPHKQIYHCFSCGAGGDALSFVMNYHKMTFREALEHLAERAAIKLTPRAAWKGTDAGEASSGVPQHDRSSLIGANQTAATFFRTILTHAEHGKGARKVIEHRGISPEMVEMFELGASPEMWDGLARTIQSKNIDASAFVAAGLLKARDGGGASGNSTGNASGVYDAFRNRLIFPIHDQIGRVIAFGGRRINDDDDPKYLNSSESSVFNKSSTLYALHQAAQEIRRSRRAIVCEGYMDAIACHQAGLTNVVATLGTALTIGNARILRRLCDQVVLLFDGDEAGQKAAERGVEVFFAEPIDVRIAILSMVTDAKDPDELVKREGGRELLDLAIAKAIDPLELLFARVQRTVQGQGLSARSRTIEEFVGRLCELGLSRVDKVRQQLIVKRVSQIAGVEWQTISELVNDRRRTVRARPSTELVATNASPLTASEHLLGCVLCEPALMHALTEEQSPLLDPDAYAPGSMQTVARAIASLVVDERPPSLQEVLAILDDTECQRVATRLATEVERVTEGSADRLHHHWRDRLRLASLEINISKLQTDFASVSTSSAADHPSGHDASPSSSPGARDTSWSDLALKAKDLQSQRRQFGHDPRVLPRTGS